MPYHFRNLVFEGGGVKGIAYVGAMESLGRRCKSVNALTCCRSPFPSNVFGFCTRWRDLRPPTTCPVRYGLTVI
jgi:hypothetical protein